MESNAAAELPIQDRLLAWFELNRRQVYWGTGIILALGTAVGIYFWHQYQRQVNANTALSVALVQAPTAEASQLAEAMVRVASEHPGTDAGGRALLLGGAEYFQAGKYAEALGIFQRFRKEYPDSPFGSQALYGAATCLEAEGKTEEALAGYSDIVQHYSSANVSVPAQFAIGRIAEAQNKWEDAAHAYEALNRDRAAGYLGMVAGVRLHEIFEEHPELVPNQPAVTNTPTLKFNQP